MQILVNTPHFLPSQCTLVPSAPTNVVVQATLPHPYLSNQLQVLVVRQVHHQPPYSGKLLREKTFATFAVLWLFAKVISVKFGGVVPLEWQKQAIHGSFLHENHVLAQRVGQVTAHGGCCGQLQKGLGHHQLGQWSPFLHKWAQKMLIFPRKRLNFWHCQQFSLHTTGIHRLTALTIENPPISGGG